MRFLVQFLVPALIFAGVVYLLTRRSRHSGSENARSDSDTGPFIVILLVSAAVALGTAFLLQAMWE